MVGCSQIEESDLDNAKETESLFAVQTRSGGEDGTFDTLRNPYGLEVMQAVYDTYGSGNVILQPTDLYVRFLLQDSLQLDVLRFGCGLELFEYPLDLNVV